MRRLIAPSVAVLALSLAGTAAAHGPCPTCIEPNAAAVGERVDVDYQTYLAVWNPRRAVLTRGPKPYCYGCQLHLWRFHVNGAPSPVVFLHRPRVGTFSFEVPQVRPGRYLVALFDGSEGGTHYTWDFVTVRAARIDSSGEAPKLLLALAAALMVLAVTALLAVRRRRRT